MSKMAVSIITASFIIFGLTAVEAEAASYDLQYVFNGTAFDTSNNYLTASFEDFGTNTVKLTLTSNLENPAYYIQQVAFNVADNIVPKSLKFAISANGTLLSKGRIARTKQDAQNLPGGGNLGVGFDVLLRFPTAKRYRFNGSDTVVLIISGEGIDASDFDILNTTDVANVAAHVVGGHIAGADIAGLEGSTSAAITNSAATANNVPIPAAAWLLGSGLLGMIAIRRRFRK